MRVAAAITLAVVALTSSPAAAVPLPASVEVEVTGDPTPGPFVARAVERALRWALRSEDLSITFMPPPADLDAGTDAVVQAHVRRQGASASSESVVPVLVRNTPSGCQRAQLLFVSNSPETLRFATGLFRGSLGSGETVRLLYHHRNGTPETMTLHVQVANPSRVPARLWVSDASAPPVRDEINAGHVAGGRWLRQYWTCAAQRVTLAPHSTLELDIVTTVRDQVGSGVLQAWLEGGERAVISVLARVGTLDPAPSSYLINKDAAHARGTFPGPVRELRIEHTAGDVTLVSIGQADPATDVTSGRPLRGNYGVIHNVRGMLVNPDQQQRRIILRAVAAGGPARGTFLINGQIVETGYLRPGEPAVITTMTLAPRTRIPFFLSTMPQSGSAYPLRLMLGPP